VALPVADIRVNPLRSLAGNGVANSVQRMPILCVGHPNAGQVLCAFEAA
jgi:hypothetical protein